RTATVTISAPDAATACAFCSKFLYLPVPTISRDVKVLPATLQVSPISAAPHEGDDLVIVAILDRHFTERRARHDLQIALHRDLGRLQAELEREVGDRYSLGHPAMAAVDPD